MKDRDQLLDHLLMAYGLAQDGKRDQALTVLDQCAAEAHEAASQADVSFYRGLIARVLGNSQESAIVLSEAQKMYERLDDFEHAAVAASYRGRLASEQGNFTQALESHHNAFQFFLKTGDLASVGSELTHMGLILRQLHLHTQALEFFQQALEAHQAADEQSNILLDRLNLAATAMDLEQRDLARAQLEATWVLAEQIGDKLGQARTSYLLANLAADSGDLLTALGLYEKAKLGAETLHDHKLIADIQLGFGLTRYALGELGTASNSLTAALEQYVQIQDLEGQASAFGNLGLVHLANGGLQKAKDCFETAIQLHQQLGDRKGEAKQIGNLGLVQRALGQWNDAEQLHRQALQALEELEDLIGQAAQWVNLASLEFLRGQLNNADIMYKHALALYQSAGYLEGQASVKANLGNVAHARSKWETALRLYHEALTLYRQLSHHRGEAGVLANIGVVYRELGRYEDAIQQYQQALGLDRAAHDRPGEASVLNNLALARRQVGDAASALDNLNSALALYETIGDRRGQAATLDNLGILFLDNRQPMEAVEYYQRALTIYQELGLRAGMMSSRGNLGNALIALDKNDDARQNLNYALNEAHALGDTDAQARLLVAYGDAYRRQGDLRAARSHYEKALKLIEEQRLDLLLETHREKFLGQERGSVYARLVKVLLLDKMNEQAWQVCEQSRSRIFLDQLALSHWPRPASVDSVWWDDVIATLDKMRTLSSNSSFDKEDVTFSQQRWTLFSAAKEHLKELLDSAARSAKDWGELLKGYTLSYQDLYACLSVKSRMEL